MILLDELARANPEYVDALYRQYQRDPTSVDERWGLIFAGYELDIGRSRPEPDGTLVHDGVLDLVHSYRELGHLVADLDPLGQSPRSHPLLRLEEFGFAEADLDRVVSAGSFRGLGLPDSARLREVLAALQATYCGTLGVEHLDIRDKEQRDWLQARMEPERNRPRLSSEDRIELLRRLISVQEFEHFLHTKYVGQKRFSLEGAEALVPLLDTLIEEGAASGVEEMVMGMAHRGRLNVLAHVLHKPCEMIFAEFEGVFLPAGIQGDGDVKYHLGYSHDHQTLAEKRIHVSLIANPSHLEAIDPVVEGIVRAKQNYRGDSERRRVVPVLIHGDAAFAGQGIVYETLAFSELPGFTTGGTVHVILNNQIGFTTSPEDYRFTRYPSELASVIQAPVFHVNADDPEAAIQAARLALEFRQAFRIDVFIDLVCYRRHGHNEIDDPTFTQPVLYRTIQNHPTVTTLYEDRLRREDLVDEAQAAALRENRRSLFEDALTYARDFLPRQHVLALGGVWKGFTWASDDWSARTEVEPSRLREIAEGLAQLPANFHPHPRVRKLLDQRRAMVLEGEKIDWGCAEALAFGTLLLEGIPVRLSGQDSARGTFSHRHAVLFDGETNEPYVPLNHLAPKQAEIEVVNSLLSEAGALGFEYGMASADPRRLVIWEAQFGDFVNGAQVIVDQFLSSGESKWQRMNGLTLFLPHGYEGQGPEHSSARPERFLQLCAEGNLQVVKCTKPAQLFHLLRRQVHWSFRKPLVVMAPKSLLRHARAVSSLTEFTSHGFQPVLGDPGNLPVKDVQRVLLCSGKIFYRLEAERAERERRDVAILRVEQLYPFPASELAEALRPYSRVREFCWVQEEPRNQGAWFFVRPRVEPLLPGGATLGYAGRDEAASPATGNYKVHVEEEETLIEAALRRPREPQRASRPAKVERAAG